MVSNMNCNKKPKYNLGDKVYYLNNDERYRIYEGTVVGINYNKLLDTFSYNIESASFFGTTYRKSSIEETHIFINEEDAKKYAYLIFVNMCNDINDVINGKAKFAHYSTLRDCLEKMQYLNEAFGFQMQIYPYQCKKDLKKEIKRLKGE